MLSETIMLNAAQLSNLDEQCADSAEMVSRDDALSESLYASEGSSESTDARMMACEVCVCRAHTTRAYALHI